MLRRVLIGVATVCLCGGLLCLALGWLRPASGAAVFWSAVVLIGLAFDRFRYKPLLAAPPGPDWRDTGERFVDPRTRRPVAVYAEPGTQTRAYVGLASSSREGDQQ